jgi:hypothetical protein
VIRIGNALPLRSNLWHQDVQDMSAHAIDLLTTLNLLFKRLEMPFDLCFKMQDRTILDCYAFESLAQQTTRMLSHFCRQSRNDLLLRGLHTWMHEPGSVDRVAFSRTPCLHDPFPREAEPIAEHHRQCPPGCFQHCVDAIDQPSSLLDQAHTQPSEIAQIVLFLTGNNAGGEQALRQHIGHPVGILHLCLPAWNCLEMLRIGDKQFKEPFQTSRDWHPIASCAFHSNSTALFLHQPRAERTEIRCLVANTADLCASLARFGHTQTHDEKALMHIHTCAPLIHHFPVLTPFLGATKLVGVCLFRLFSGLSRLLEQVRRQGVVHPHT